MNNQKTILIILAALFLISIASTSVNAYDPYDDEYYDDVWAPGLFGGLFAGVFCIIPIIVFIIGIVIAIWVYKDAEKRGSSGALWLIIVIFTGIIGLIIWLVVRPPIGGKKSEGVASSSGSGSDRRCPNCGRVIPNDANLCPYCKKDFGT
ncbi:MAG: zinc ribbon domain-containing protein [Candidatus Thermoplasmatota archaeon]|nr:zinc ribbon domain-containing protein [Candidatus Thermoplasmatota archaeon]